MAVDPYLSLLRSLTLSKSERELVRRYENDPEGRAFLPIADILRSQKLVDESLELLAAGVARHPAFTVARVVLARELYHKGAVRDAWEVLEQSPVPLTENVLAQKLRFKLAALLGMERESRASFRHLVTHRMVDAETKRLGDVLEMQGVAALAPRLVQELLDRGLTPVRAQEVRSLTSRQGTARSATENTGQAKGVGEKGEANAEAGVDPLLATAPASTWSGFHVTALEEIFNAPLGVATSVDPSHAPAAGAMGRSASAPELDSTTLAEIYAGQGLFSKALSVYRRLLKLNPSSEVLRNKIADLLRAESQASLQDPQSDQGRFDIAQEVATTLDHLEHVAIIDRQLVFLKGLLQTLEKEAEFA